MKNKMITKRITSIFLILAVMSVAVFSVSASKVSAIDFGKMETLFIRNDNGSVEEIKMIPLSAPRSLTDKEILSITKNKSTEQLCPCGTTANWVYMQNSMLVFNIISGGCMEYVYADFVYCESCMTMMTQDYKVISGPFILHLRINPNGIWCDACGRIVW